MERLLLSEFQHSSAKGIQGVNGVMLLVELLPSRSNFRGKGSTFPCSSCRPILLLNFGFLLCYAHFINVTRLFFCKKMPKFSALSWTDSFKHILVQRMKFASYSTGFQVGRRSLQRTTLQCFLMLQADKASWWDKVTANVDSSGWAWGTVIKLHVPAPGYLQTPSHSLVP